MSHITHYSDSSEYRFPYGAVPVGTRVWVKAESDCDLSLNVTYMSGDITESSSVNTDRGSAFIECSRPGVYLYSFSSDDGTVSEQYQITSYERGLSVPEWFKNTVIYQIFPDRFAKADTETEHKKNSFLYATDEDIPMYIKDESGDIIRWDFFGGNLDGIREKIGYLKSLGIGTFYLNPIFESVSNHRYDTSDYMHVDGLLGGDDAFRRLADDCGRNGIRLILDGVFSHTGAQSPFFDADGTFSEGKPEEEKGACVSEKSKYRPWYTFKDDGSYECWWDIKALPNVKELEPTYLGYTVTGEDSVVRHWLRMGASGWRLDVADELPDEFIIELRKAAEEALGDAVIMGEVWEDASNKISYGKMRDYFTRKELHTCTNYPFRNNILAFLDGSDSAHETAGKFRKMKENYPSENFYSLVNMTGTHDVERLFTCLKRISPENAVFLLKAYSLIQFTFPGVPLIYYGDEICLEGGTDPDNRRIFPHRTLNGHADTADWFATLSRIRKNNSALVSGTFDIYALDDNTLIVERSDGTRVFVTAVCRIKSNMNLIYEHLENKFGKSYNILTEIDGFGFLAELSGQ